MSYATSLPLQEAVFAALAGSAELAALVGGRIHDAAPHADDPAAEAGPFVTLGDERVADWSSAGGAGARHDIEIAVHSGAEGFAEAKSVAGVVADVVGAMAGPMSRGRIVLARFLAARTRRTRGGGRRIDLRFRVLVAE